MMLAAALSTLLSQFPNEIPPKSVSLEVNGGWVMFSGDGRLLGQFSEIDGIRVASMTAIPSGGGAVFTGPRTGKPNGLFWKRVGGNAEDISLSDGYHAWPAVSPSGGSLVVAHNPGSESGPMGAHGATANAQLWLMSLASKKHKPRQLTDSPGCKSSPSFKNETTIAYGHSNCRGRQGVEWLSSATATSAVIVESNDVRNDLNPRLAPDGRRIAFVRSNFRTWQVIVADWPSMKNQQVLLTVALDGSSPMIDWLQDSRMLLVSEMSDVVKIDTKLGSVETAWSARGAE